LAIASAFVAKAVYGFGVTRQLLDALASDSQLRCICGWKEARHVPSESTFSRAFDEFSRMELPQFVRETLIRENLKDQLIGHIARDSTTIEAREHYPGNTHPGSGDKTGGEGGEPGGKESRAQEGYGRSACAISRWQAAQSAQARHASGTAEEHETAGNVGRFATGLRLRREERQPWE
jgi:hypothetical protein